MLRNIRSYNILKQHLDHQQKFNENLGLNPCCPDC